MNNLEYQGRVLHRFPTFVWHSRLSILFGWTLDQSSLDIESREMNLGTG